MGLCANRGAEWPQSHMVYRGTSRGFHHFTHVDVCDQNRIAEPFRIATSEVIVAPIMPVTGETNKWRYFETLLTEDARVYRLVELPLAPLRIVTHDDRTTESNATSGEQQARRTTNQRHDSCGE